MSRAPAYVIKAIKDAREAATHANASFDMDPEKDAEIKEQTRLYNASWIIAPLDRALKWAEGPKPALTSHDGGSK